MKDTNVTDPTYTTLIVKVNGHFMCTCNVTDDAHATVTAMTLAHGDWGRDADVCVIGMRGTREVFAFFS